MATAGASSLTSHGAANASRAFDVRGIRALAILAVVAVLALVTGMTITAQQINRNALMGEETRTLRGFDAVAENREHQLGSAANWDDAVQNLAIRFSERWAQANLVSPFPQDPIGQAVLVLDSKDNVIFAREHAQPMASARLAVLRAAIGPLLASTRARSAASAPTSPPSDRNGNWVVGSETVLWQGRPTLVSAAPVGPDEGEVVQHTGRPPIIVYAGDIERYVLPGLARRLLLASPVLGTAPAVPHAAYIWLTDSAGRRVAFLQWQPVQYGTRLFLSAAPVLCIVVLVLLLAVVMAYRQGVLGTRALVASEARASYAMLHDPLTGLGTRPTLRARLDDAIGRAPGMAAVLVIDLDRFRIINDMHGYSVGNEVLVTLSRRLVDACGPDDRCLRTGADEFLVISAGRGEAELARFAETLLALVQTPVDLGGLTLRLTAGLGMCLQADDHPDAADLQHHAEIALYAAKKAGPGESRLFVPSMDEAMRCREQLEADLRRAVEDGRIDVVYQPQYAGERIAGVEALARWADPERGEISPSSFVPLAEAGGIINDLGRLVMQRAFSNVPRWSTLTVAVNISPAQLLAPGFVDWVTSCAQKHGADPRRIELEITESLLLADTPQIQKVLASLRAAGFRLVLDDFGTGYCSLSYLHKFPIDKIKIDRSFVSRVPNDTAAVSVIQAIVRLARALKLDVTAEGVESAEQRRTLTALGCRLIQGYFTGMPMPQDRIDALAFTRPWSGGGEPRLMQARGPAPAPRQGQGSLDPFT